MDINLLLVVRNFLEGQFFGWIGIFQRDKFIVGG